MSASHLLPDLLSPGLGMWIYLRGVKRQLEVIECLTTKQTTVAVLAGQVNISRLNQMASSSTDTHDGVAVKDADSRDSDRDNGLLKAQTKDMLSIC